MNIPHNSQDFRYGKYSVFAVAFALVAILPSATPKLTGETGEGQEHRDSVANVVQELRKVAGQETNLGQEISKIAKEQEDSSKEDETAMDQVESVGKFRVLFFGTDYKNLGILRSNLVKTQNAIERLTKAMEQSTDAIVKAELQKQIDALKAIETKAQTFIKDHESQFSFLGWLVRLFTK